MKGEGREELLSLLARFLDPSCHSERAFARLAREVVYSPTLGALAREVLDVTERMGIRSPADALDAWREKTGPLLGELCCEPGTEVVDSLFGEPWRPGTDPPFAWLEGCCDRCYGVFFRALERQRYLSAASAFDAWNLFEEEDALARAFSDLELEASVRFTDPRRGRDACRSAYRLTREALPKTPGRLDDPERAVALSLHAVAAARLMNAYRYTSDVSSAREMLAEVERLVPACLPFHRAEVDALIGVLRTYLGDTEDGLSRIRAAARSLNGVDRHLSGLWTVQLAQASRDSGVDSFLATLQEGMSLLDQRRDPTLHQMSAINLGSMLTARGMPSNALHIIEGIGFVNRHFAATGTAAKADAFMCLGQYDSAYDRICEAITEYTSLDRQPDTAYCLLLRGEILQKKGLLANSLRDFFAAMEMFESLHYSTFRDGALQDLQRAVEAEDACRAAVLSKRVREQFELLPKGQRERDINPRG